MINGTEGITFHPLIEKGEVLQVFTEDLLRASDIVYASDTSYKGIDLYRYELAPCELYFFCFCLKKIFLLLLQLLLLLL